MDIVAATQKGVPDQSLLEELTAYFQERREIAVDLQVRAPKIHSVALTVRVAAREGWDRTQVLTQVEERLRGWFTGQRLGQDVLLAQLGSLIFGCDGVANYAIDSPAADILIEADELPQLNSLRVEAMA